MLVPDTRHHMLHRPGKVNGRWPCRNQSARRSLKLRQGVTRALVRRPTKQQSIGRRKPDGWRTSNSQRLNCFDHAIRCGAVQISGFRRQPPLVQNAKLRGRRDNAPWQRRGGCHVSLLLTPTPC